MALALPGGVQLEVLVRSEDADGRFCLVRDRLPAGWMLPGHRHRAESETITVLSGLLRMTVDANVHDLGPGDCIHVPAGVRHDGAVVGETAVARIVVFSPGGMERFFEELAGVGDDGTQALGLAIQHGWEFA